MFYYWWIRKKDVRKDHKANTIRGSLDVHYIYDNEKGGSLYDDGTRRITGSTKTGKRVILFGRDSPGRDEEDQGDIYKWVWKGPIFSRSSKPDRISIDNNSDEAAETPNSITYNINKVERGSDLTISSKWYPDLFTVTQFDNAGNIIATNVVLLGSTDFQGTGNGAKRQIITLNALTVRVTVNVATQLNHPVRPGVITNGPSHDGTKTAYSIQWEKIWGFKINWKNFGWKKVPIEDTIK